MRSLYRRLDLQWWVQLLVSAWHNQPQQSDANRTLGSKHLVAPNSKSCLVLLLTVASAAQAAETGTERDSHMSATRGMSRTCLPCAASAVHPPLLEAPL